MSTGSQVKIAAPAAHTPVAKTASQPLMSPMVDAVEAPSITEQLERARLGHNFGAISVFPPDPPIQPKRAMGLGQRLSAFSQPSQSRANPAPIIPAGWAVRPTIQAKLTVGQPNDPYEQEADGVADQVMRMAESRVQAKCACGGEAGPDGECAACKAQRLGIQRQVQDETAEAEDIVQAKSDSAPADAAPDLESRLNGSRGSGQALPAETLSSMESAFGVDFGGVRVHTGSDATQMNKELSAQAFTHGSDIYFNAGKYEPGSEEGKQLLAHELTHVIQQDSTLVKRRTDLSEVVQRDGGEELEYEENSVIQRSMLPNALTQRSGGPIIQRDLTDRLNKAMSGWGTDSAAILQAIRTAPADQKQIVLRDPVLIERLRSKLSRADAITALTELGAPLAQRIEVAMSGWGVDSAAILNMITRAPADQKQAALRNPTLIANLRRNLSRADALTALQGLGAGLAERMHAAMDGWGVDSNAIIRMARGANAADKQAALHDRALIARLKDELSRPQMLNVLEQLGASIADRLNTAMDGWGVDSAMILTLTQNATVAQRQEMLSDSALLARLQRELSRADLATVLANVHASLADRLNLALGGWGADSANILAMIRAAPEAERLAAHDDLAVIAKLKSKLNDASYWQARLLLRFGNQAIIDAPSAQVPALSNGIYYRVDAHIQARERAEALSTMVSALETRGALVRANYTEISYDASGVGEGLTTVSGYNHNVATGRWTIIGLPRVTVHPAGFTDVGWLYSTVMHEYQHVLQFTAGYNADPNSQAVIDSDEVNAYLWEIEHAVDTGVINQPAQLHDVGNRLTTNFNALPVVRKATYQARYNAAIAVVNAVPLPAVGAAAPAGAPQSLTTLLTMAMEQSPPDTAKMLRDITAASAVDKDPVRLNHSLMARLATTLNQVDMRQALQLLGAPMIERLNLLLNQNATVGDIVALANSGTPADKQAVLDNAEQVNRLLAYLNRVDAGTVLTALGDTLANRLNRAATGGTVDENAIFALIRAANAAERTTMTLNSTLLVTLSGVLSPYNYWKVRLLLEYGTEASFPTAVTTMVTALRGAPTAATIRTTITSLNEGDYAIVKDLVGIREILRALVTNDADYMLIRRALEQGMISEETNVSGAYAETLLVPTPGAPALTFQPQVFNGTRGFDVAYYRDRLQVRVRISLNPMDAQARRDQSAREQQWEPMIEGAWDSKFNLRNANHTLPIRVSVSFTSSSPHHTVNIYSTPSTGWPAYNEFNWYYNDPNYPATSPIHEFGHMLSNPDEYDISAADFATTVGAAPTAANARISAPDTAGVRKYSATNSVMGLGGPVQMRHLNYFVNWINNHRRTNPIGAFAEPAFTIV